jgi:hypothetical protein
MKKKLLVITLALGILAIPITIYAAKKPCTVEATVCNNGNEVITSDGTTYAIDNVLGLKNGAKVRVLIENGKCKSIAYGASVEQAKADGLDTSSFPVIQGRLE